MLLSTNQTVAARYLFDPFGRTLSAVGALAEANLYRFSSKEAHLNSGLAYYLYRYYAPECQRWINRDPIQERDDISLYRFVRNNPNSNADPYGLGKCCNHGSTTEWILNGSGQWVSLAPGDCTGLFTDCEGMTCAGYFYYARDLEVDSCNGCCFGPAQAPRGQQICWADRAWSPAWQGSNARSPGPGGGTPEHRTAPNNNPPPGYKWVTAD